MHRIRARYFLPLGLLAASLAAATASDGKNWIAPARTIHAQTLIDELIRRHPEVISITFHGTPPGKSGIYTMFAGSFPERIGNPSSAYDVATITKGFTQIEPGWNTSTWRKKVVVFLPLRDASGKYLPVAMVIAFRTSADDERRDTDFLQPAVAIRDGLRSSVPSFESLFAPAR